MPDLILLAVVPAVTALIGWVTNWSAVKMIFFPEKFVGIRPFLGWQAIIVKQGDKFAKGVADMVTENLISARELAERLDPDELDALFGEAVTKDADFLVAEVAEELSPGTWANLAAPVQSMITTAVVAEARKLGKEIFTALRDISDELLDLHRLVTDELSGENVTRLSNLTQKIGKAEFKFIEIYGGVFGLIVGIGQVFVWEAMQTWWLMPIVGVFVGLATNYLAIQMIFRPQEPKRYFGLITYQGLFAKRQAEIAKDYGETAANEILTPENALRLVTEGDAGERIAKVVTEMVAERIEEQRKNLSAVAPIELTDAKIERVRALIVARLASSAPGVQPEIEAYVERKLDIANTIETRLANLPKNDFERILRGIFEEDELTLVIVGGVLGGAVGWLQGLLVLSL